MFIPPFTIEDVAQLLFIERIPSRSSQDSSFPVVCPFCGDRRGKMNFCICKDGDIKNTYHCYNCGEQGNMLQLYARLNGIQGTDCCKTAYHEIRHRLDGKACTDYHKVREKQLARMAEASAEPADYGKRDLVYREMLSMLHLKKRHRENLLERGFTFRQTEQMEELGFKSTEPEAAGSICRRLLKKGYSLDGIPGFYLNRNGDWRIAFFDYNAGMLCPAWTRNRELAGFQIRLDSPYKGMKYSWLTSSGKERGCSSKSPAGFFGKPDASIVYVTEGILKAAAAHLATGKTFIGNPGVGHYKEIAVILKQMKENGLKLVYECYDMDKLLNLACREDYDEACARCALEERGGTECPKKKKKREDIRRGCNHLYRACEELSLKCLRVTWDTDKDGLWAGRQKGVDDWKLEEQKEHMKENRGCRDDAAA